MRPFAELGGAVEPKVVVPPAGWFGIRVDVLAINRIGFVALLRFR